MKAVSFFFFKTSISWGTLEMRWSVIAISCGLSVVEAMGNPIVVYGVCEGRRSTRGKKKYKDFFMTMMTVLRKRLQKDSIVYPNVVDRIFFYFFLSCNEVM